MTDTVTPTVTRTAMPKGVLAPIDVRLRMSALWIATMFLFAYVDLFSLYRPDFRANLEQDKVFFFDVGEPFLFGITLYIAIPSILIYLTLVLPRRANRIVNISAGALYAVTIVGSAIGEWSYYIVGSALEGGLLVVLIHHAWTWRAAGLERP